MLCTYYDTWGTSCVLSRKSIVAENVTQSISEKVNKSIGVTFSGVAIIQF